MSFFNSTIGNSIRIIGGSAKIRVAEPQVLYYNAAIDNDWGNLGNWWLNETHTQPASRLPRSIDSVVLTKPCYANSTSSIATVISLTMNDPGTGPFPPELGINIIVKNAIFNDSCGNVDTIIGNVIFNDSSVNNYGTVIGNVVFNNDSINFYGYIDGNVVFNDNATNFSSTINNSINTLFNNNSYNLGIINNNAIFNNNSINEGTINGDAIFNDSTNNLGTVVGNIIDNRSITLYFNNTVNNLWSSVDNWWLDSNHTQPAGRLPTSSDSVITSVNSRGSGQTVFNFTLNANVQLQGNIIVNGVATFNSGTLSGSIAGNAIFNGGSTNNTNGVVDGNATFNDNSQNSGNVVGTATFTGSSCNVSNIFVSGTAGTFVPNPPPSCN
jgi:hypothetical protein